MTSGMTHGITTLPRKVEVEISTHLGLVPGKDKRRDKTKDRQVSDTWLGRERNTSDVPPGKEYYAFTVGGIP